jgi:D-alanyl-lipoteichoic acid acyltransferase DltB (MBOAT superfamily)
MVFDTSHLSMTAIAGGHLLIGLLVAAALSLAISLVPILQRERGLSLATLLGAAVYHWQAFAGFAAVTGIAFFAVRCLDRQTVPSRRWKWACAGLFALLVVFTLGRIQHWDLPFVVGSTPIVFYSLDMWLMLRLMTLIWEVGSNTVVAPTFSRYVIWTCLPFTLGGPLLRFSEMPKTIQGNPRLWLSAAWWRETSLAAATLLLGIALGIGQQIMSSHWPHAHLRNSAVLTFVTGPIGFYLTTAGFFRLMEVLGQPAGFKLPASFNYPIGRENISAFWMNWNMTATYVFRDYLFYNRWGRQTYNIYFNTIVLFTLVGLWHAANAYWILWGVLHGLLFCGFLAWRKYRNLLGHIPLSGTAGATLAARLLTYVSVCMCWYLPSKIIQKVSASFG